MSVLSKRVGSTSRVMVSRLATVNERIAILCLMPCSKRLSSGGGGYQVLHRPTRAMSFNVLRADKSYCRECLYGG
jgi:hypothetical protein